MSDPFTHVQFQKQAQDNIQNAINLLTRNGYSIFSPEVTRLSNVLTQYLPDLGLAVPRPVSFILRLFGLSPGELRLFQDAELGWLVEIVERPGAEPVRKYISEDLAAELLRGELTHERFEQLATPEEPYIA